MGDTNEDDGWPDFGDYVNRRLPALLRSATALCGEVGLAEDVVQDVLIKAGARWDRISRTDNVDAYLRRMLVNEFVSWRRKWARLIPTERVEPTAHEPDLAAGVSERDLMRRRLDSLPHKQRAVLALRYYDGLTDTEIADALGCRAVTVRAYASRALARLRDQIPACPARPQETS